MNKEILIFQSPDFGQIRTATDEKGEPLFCLNDVCRALELEGKQVNRRLSDEVVSKHPITDSLGRTQLASFVNEDGLYDVILDSRKAEARRFRKWVTSVVLPQIRKTGGFIPTSNMQTGEELSDMEIMALAVKIQQRTIEERERRIAGLESSVALLAPKAEYCDEVLDSVDCMTTTQVAKGLGMSAQELNQWLCDRGVQYWQSGQYMLYADYARRGFAKNRTHSYHDSEGMRSHSYLVWTERGREFITRMVNDSCR